jgi:nicotinamide mononucleotide (NMN) deamidase PncC
LSKDVIQQIHDRDGKFIVAVTGGGASVVAELLAVAGASNTLLSAFIPYHEEELADYLGGSPDTACSSRTARALAMVSWQRAQKLTQQVPVYGVGCTAALATNRERRGEDRCFVAVQSAESTLEVSVTFDKSARSRQEEERLCCSLVLDLMADVLGISSDQTEGFRKSDTIRQNQVNADSSWQALLAGGTKFTATNNPPVLIFPGAFNPMHQGHAKMAEYAEQLTGHRVTLEISILNVDKPPLDFIEMQSRCDALQEWPLVFSAAPTFVEKCRLFPGSTLVVGVDTMERIVEPKYYGSSEERRDRALQEIDRLGNRFMVFGRQTPEGFTTLSSLDLPASLSNRCICITEKEFREDMSSTELRANGKPVS